MKMSSLTGFYHFTTQGWKISDDSLFRDVDLSKKTFVWKYLNGHAKEDDIDKAIDYWHSHGGEDHSLPDFLGMTRNEYEEFVLNKKPVKEILEHRMPHGRISTFYVCDLHGGSLWSSFSFCSPDDAKIGKFSKKEGREKAFKRFYGLDGEEMRRVCLSIPVYGFNDTLIHCLPYDVIRNFLLDLRDGFHTRDKNVDYDPSEDISRRYVINSEDDNYTLTKDNKLFSRTNKVYVEGILKIPTWMTLFESIKHQEVEEHGQVAAALPLCRAQVEVVV